MTDFYSYNSEPLLVKKRVLFKPATSSDTLKAGQVVCYNNDITTDIDGATVAAGTTNPGRSLIVEKPASGNLLFVAGIVCPESDGAVDGDQINIYILNGADIPVYTDANCTNGTTILAAKAGTYNVSASATGTVQIGIAKDTINRSVTNGLCLMCSQVRSKVPS